MKQRRLHRALRAGLLTGFGLILATVWLDEVIDLPHRLLDAPATPVNYLESIFESIVIIVLALVVLSINRWALGQIRTLEGMLAVCSQCKKIRAGDQWVTIESYVAGHSEATFSHSLCPECARELYGEAGVLATETQKKSGRSGDTDARTSD